MSSQPYDRIGAPIHGSAHPQSGQIRTVRGRVDRIFLGGGGWGGPAYGYGYPYGYPYGYGYPQSYPTTVYVSPTGGDRNQLRAAYHAWRNAFMSGSATPEVLANLQAQFELLL